MKHQMNMPNWIYAMDDVALLEGHMAPVYPLGINVVLARVEGMIYAVSGACAHMACPLFTGKLSGYTLACPCHDWRFDVRTGKFLDAPELGVAVFPVKSEAGKVFVKIS
jgi:3-phenylpropionate/trans-cinnamate dioxygenase ferredoxin subunit